MNAAKKPVVETFGLVKDLAKTRAPCSPYLTVAAGEVNGFLGPDGACKSEPLSILSGLIRSSAGTDRTVGVLRWGGPVGTRRHIAVLRLTVGTRRAGGRRHGPVR